MISNELIKKEIYYKNIGSVLMKMGIMQPYFLPYLGYFSLIKNTDEFILLDTVQFIRHGWIERNRILKQQEGWQYIKVPLVKHSKSTLIKDIEIKSEIDWREKIFSQLVHYKKKSPFYYETIQTLERAFDIETNSIVKLNENILNVICDYIGIKKNIKVFSEMNLKINKPEAPDEWALNICKAINNVEEYWNPEGGIKFFDINKYIDSGITVKFIKMNLSSYSQRRNSFEAGLSIVDVMMFNEPRKINNMLDEFVFLNK